MAQNIKGTTKTEVVAHGRSLRSDATVGQLVGDHFLRVQLLYACVYFSYIYILVILL
jgi:hypothetical protein